MVTNLTLNANFVDVTRPTLSIVTPTANQQWTNGTFTVTGKAGDNVAVGTVYYSLNGSGWTAATTANNWTNWTANLTLTPGTNTVQACAVDSSGNISTTNTVRFEYVVREPLTVQIMALGTLNPKWGTLNPNYTNGTPLAINENYTMTANASSGFGFTNWTDGSGNLLTNRATLQFTMVTNLTLNANFVDVTKPTLSIVTPTANQQWTNGTFTVTGKAGDNVAVGSVYYSLNGGLWTNANTANNWTNWTANLTLTPGTNTVQAYAVDTSGNLSTTNTVRFVYLVRDALDGADHGTGHSQSQVGHPQSQLYQWHAAGHQRELLDDRQSGVGFCLHQLDRRVGQPADQSCHTAIHDGDQPDVERQFCGCDQADGEHCRPRPPTSNGPTATFTVTGKAGDNVAVGTVYYSLNGGLWTNAITANNWTNWTANLTLTPGTNTVQAYAVDTSGNLSTDQHRQICLSGAPALDGAGQRQRARSNPNYNGALLAINENYTMTASRGVGFCVHQLDRRVRPRGDQSCHAAIHHGDEPDADGEFCGCDQADVEPCDTDGEFAREQRGVHGDGQGW